MQLAVDSTPVPVSPLGAFEEELASTCLIFSRPLLVDYNLPKLLYYPEVCQEIMIFESMFRGESVNKVAVTG